MKLKLNSSINFSSYMYFIRKYYSSLIFILHPHNLDCMYFVLWHGWTMKRESSPILDEYDSMVFSQETVSYIESLDVMATRKVVLTSPFRLLGSHHLGVMLTFSVYKSKLPPSLAEQERIEETVGYLGGAVDAILMNVYHITNSSDHLIMYGHQIQDDDQVLLHKCQLDFGDPFRKHRMICRYHHKTPTLWTTLTTTFSFFVICLLVGYILYGTTIHIVKVEDAFHEMQEFKVRAEVADVAKSQFLETVSNEIRTPMNGILGMLALFLDTYLSSTQRDYVQTVQVCGKALITLINEVLDCAKIKTRKLELETVSVDVRSILDDVLSLFFEKSRNKGIELAVFVSDKVPEMVTGDPGRFKQIIMNLVEKGSWLSGEDGGFKLQTLDRQKNGHVFKSPKMILLAKNICNDELEKRKAAGFADTMIMKPSRERMVVACL
ncbi:hypothetical protein ES332_A05G404300v1 [Gossypium tomentosum]|uniref:histidine kinase n=1 Tax=Gossypium tomentosum TaxID=34277 RepID=A0A5D2QRE1_GOSTO|nr:hypothetical protein ES332_A05G404300v1 [Gossypium tomentosum]